jgi:hypothetical protein
MKYTPGSFLFLLSLLLFPTQASGQSGMTLSTRARMGARYDDVRMCVATPAGVNGGPAGDVSFLFSWSAGGDRRLELDLPVMRPILFGAAFRMLQFEPSVALTFVLDRTASRELRAGPVAGLSFHHGPDEDSEPSGEGRTDAFFSMGPFAGATGSIAFLRPHGSFDVLVGLTLYATRLFAFDDDPNHQGFVFGGSIDVGLRFR